MAAFMAVGGSLHNFYMWHGGTMWGNWSDTIRGTRLTPSYANGACLASDSTINNPKYSSLAALNQLLQAYAETILHTRLPIAPSPLLVIEPRSLSITSTVGTWTSESSGGSGGSFTAATCVAGVPSQQWQLTPGVTPNSRMMTVFQTVSTGTRARTSVGSDTDTGFDGGNGSGVSAAGCWEIEGCDTGPNAAVNVNWGCKPLPKSKSSCASALCTCNGAWEITAEGSITSVMDGNCLTVPDGKGSRIQVEPCTASANQTFELAAVPSKHGVYTVRQGSLCIDGTVPVPGPPPPPPPATPPWYTTLKGAKGDPQLTFLVNDGNATVVAFKGRHYQMSARSSHLLDHSGAVLWDSEPATSDSAGQPYRPIAELGASGGRVGGSSAAAVTAGTDLIVADPKLARQALSPWSTWSDANGTWYKSTFQRPTLPAGAQLSVNLTGFVQGNLFLNGIHVAFYDLVLGNCSKPPHGEFGYWCADGYVPGRCGLPTQDTYHIPPEWVLDQNELLVWSNPTPTPTPKPWGPRYRNGTTVDVALARVVYRVDPEH
jgi:hypothetical protein